MERIQRALDLAHSQRAAALIPETALQDTLAPASVAPSLARLTGLHSALEIPVDRVALRDRRVILPDDVGAAAHAYRMLRTQLLRQVRIHKVKMIGVVSAVDAEGKTLTAANLALSIAAEPNQTALLVDLDLRKPGLAQLLGLCADQGLERWFDGSAPIDDLFVRLEGIQRLRLLPTLEAVPGSSELLAETRTHELLAELRGRYADRLVIIDLPPVLLADDFLTIAPHLDCVLLVVSEGRTRREDVTRMKELLGGVRVLGTVLNVSGESEQRSY